MDVADRKHGITDPDIHHAIRNVLRTVDRGKGLTLFIGPDHAMPLRRRFYRYL